MHKHIALVPQPKPGVYALYWGCRIFWCYDMTMHFRFRSTKPFSHGESMKIDKRLLRKLLDAACALEAYYETGMQDVEEESHIYMENSLRKWERYKAKVMDAMRAASRRPVSHTPQPRQD